MRIAEISKLMKTEQGRGIIFYSLTIISMAFFFVSGEISRNAYYMLTYISFFSFAWLVWREKKLYFYWIPTLVLLLGLSKWVWAITTINHQLPLIAEHYKISGKRMILGAFVIYCVYRLSPEWRLPARLVQVGTLILCLTIFVVACIGIEQVIHTGERPKINSDAATSGAYMFTVLSLVTLWSLRRVFPRHYAAPYFITLVVSFILLGVTQTRSAILLFSLFCIASMLHHIVTTPGRSRLIWLGIFSAILLTGIFSLSKYSDQLFDRVETVKTEVQQYSAGDPSTSIGGRFGMWQAGLWAFTQHPWGQSADTRSLETKEWLDKHQPKNEIAYLNIQYHTHNDLVESFSLQGIVGGMIMLGFFLGLLLVPLFGKSPRYEALLLAIPVIYFSMGDSQFYNRESPYFILLVWGYFMMTRQVKTEHSRHHD